MLSTDEIIKKRYASVDAKNIEEFINLLSDDHRLVFAHRAPVIGKENAREQVLEFWSMIKSVRHEITHIHDCGDTQLIEALVHYEMPDGSKHEIPCCDVMEIRSGKILEQRAYLDQSSLFA